MDIQKEREAFENHLKKMGKTDNETFSKNEDDSYQMDIIHFGWKIWQAAIARMEVRINTLDEILLNQGKALAQAKAHEAEKLKGCVVVPVRTDNEIIDQTIKLMDLLATSTNRFQRDPKCIFPFESNNPRVKEWWYVACQIQELLTNTDPTNCDFDEYKADVEAARGGNENT